MPDPVTDRANHAALLATPFGPCGWPLQPPSFDTGRSPGIDASYKPRTRIAGPARKGPARSARGTGAGWRAPEAVSAPIQHSLDGEEGAVYATNLSMNDVEAGKRGRVGPGWSLDLPFDHGLEVTVDRVVQVRVEFVAYDGVLAVPVMVIASPAPPA